MIEITSDVSLQTNVLRALPSPVLAFDLNYQIVVWNQAMSDITGLAEVDVLGQSMFLISSSFSDARAKIAEIVGVDTSEFPITLNSLNYIARGNIVKDPSGKTLGGVIGFELQPVGTGSEELLNKLNVDGIGGFMGQLFKNSPLGIALIDLEFRILSINPGFSKIFGYSVDEILGKSLNSFLVPHTKQSEANGLNTSLLEGEIDYFESVRLHKSGHEVPVLIYAQPVEDEGRTVAYFGIYIDIHERVGIEDELKTRNMELDNFVYKVSHDLRAPLASVLGLINLTKLEEKPETQAFYVDLMEEQVAKLDHFIHDILSHSKNLKLDVVISDIDFSEIISTCFSDLHYLKHASAIKFNVQIDGENFRSDKWRIGEIFRNLISNAIKYANPENPQMTVDIKVVVKDIGAHITIADNGLGIAEEYQSRIFDMFYRGTDTSDGSGIGLYIVKNAVKKLKGKIDMQSKSRKGTTFSIYLPNS